MNVAELSIEDGELISPWGEVSGIGPVVALSVWLVAHLLQSHSFFCPTGNRLLGLGMARATRDGRLLIDLEMEKVRIVYDLHPARLDSQHLYIGVRREKLGG